jgi:hypothetical protein
MSKLTKQERQELITRGEGWKLADEKRLLFPVIDQSDINHIPGFIGTYSYLSEPEKKLIRRRAIKAAERQGLKLPPSLQKEQAIMKREEKETLREIANFIFEHRAAIFSDSDDDLEAVRREAEKWADGRNGKSGERANLSSGDGVEAARVAAERFADEFNRKHGARG